MQNINAKTQTVRTCIYVYMFKCDHFSLYCLFLVCMICYILSDIRTLIVQFGGIFKIRYKRMGFGQRRPHFLANNEFLCVWEGVVGGWGSKLSWRGKSLTHTHLPLILSCRFRQLLFFSFPLFITVVLSVPFFIPVSYGHCLFIGNVSSGGENITEVTESTLTPTPTLTQDPDTYVSHLRTRISHMHYIN